MITKVVQNISHGKKKDNVYLNVSRGIHDHAFIHYNTCIL